jgi:hypothetical protein
MEDNNNNKNNNNDNNNTGNFREMGYECTKCIYVAQTDFHDSFLSFREEEE